MTLRAARHRKSTYDKWIGRRFGRWTVIDLAGYRKYTLAVVARCGCGIESVVPACNLTRGASTQCAACGLEASHKTALNNSIGRPVGKGRIVARSAGGCVTIRCPCGGTAKRTKHALYGTGLCDECLYKRRVNVDYVAGMSITQIAALLGITKQAVSHYRIHRGDGALAARVAKARP